MSKKTITKEDLVNFVMKRLAVAEGSCNSHHIDCVEHQIRGAIWLFNGNDPGRFNNTADICKAIGIPYRVEGNQLYWGDQA